jgi:microcystin-dependent protein
MSFLQNDISIETVPGTVIGYTSNTIPSGWLLCDGLEYSRTTYSELYAVIGTAYGAGDGTNTFNVPNFQAAFLRGAGSQTYSGTTYGPRGINTAQGSALQTHTHSVPANTHTHVVPSTTHTHTVSDPGHAHTVSELGGAYNYQENPKNTTFSFSSNNLVGTSASIGGATSGITKINSSTSNITKGNTGSTNITATNGATGANSTAVAQNANETIPFNYAIKWIIKY